MKSYLAGPLWAAAAVVAMISVRIMELFRTTGFEHSSRPSLIGTDAAIKQSAAAIKQSAIEK